MPRPIVTIPPSTFDQNNSGKNVKVRNTLNWVNNETWPLEFEFSEAYLSSGLEPWLVLALLPAMKAGADLELSSLVSPRLLKNLDQIQVVYNVWNPTFNKIEIQAPPSQETVFKKNAVKKTALFFSGGIDSYYSLLKHFDEIDTLIFVTTPSACADGF